MKIKYFSVFITIVLFASVGGSLYAFQTGNAKFGKINFSSSWELLDTGITDKYLNAIYMLSSDTGWIAGQNGTILKTTTSGTTWTQQTSGTTNWLYSVFFIDALRGWCVGEDGLILKTEDGGSMWIETGQSISARLFSVYFVAEDTGWVAGENGAIYSTTDGGSTWTLQNSGNVWLKSICFISSTTGWAAGYGGTILKTTNAGTNWISQNSGKTYWLNSLYFIDVSNGYAAGSNGTVLKTTDGGENWQKLSSGYTGELKDVFFVDEKLGFFCGNNGVVRVTENSGTTWQSVSTPTTNNLESIFFTDDTTGWISGRNGTVLKGRFYRTKGLELNNTSYDFGTVETGKTAGTSVILENIGYPSISLDSARLNSEVFSVISPSFPSEVETYSKDEIKITFTPASESSYEDTLYLFHEGNEKLIVLMGTGIDMNYPPVFYPGLYYGFYAGEDLSIPFSGIDPEGSALSFFVGETKTTGGFDPASNTYQWTPAAPDTGTYTLNVKASDDNGSIEKNVTLDVASHGEWIKTLQPEIPMDIVKLEIINDSLLIGISAGGKIIKTEDTGINWRVIETGFSFEFKDISFADENTGWITGTNGRVIKTTDSGENWTQKFSGIDQTFTSICAVNQSECWAVGQSGKVYYTTDGGNNWNSKNLGVLIWFYDIFFADELTGWICGENGIVFKTTDGGTTWSRQTTAVSDDIYTLFFTDSTCGWIAGENKLVMKTIDAGNNWERQSIGSSVDFNNICFIDRLTGFVCSEDNVLLKTTDGGTNWSEIEPDMPGKFYSVVFNGKRQGWLSGDKGLLLSSHDIGATWYSQFNVRSADVNDIFFIDGSTGWMLTNYSGIYKSTNRGLTWSEQEPRVSYELNALYFTGEENGIIVGNSGTLLRTTNGGNTWTYSKISSYNLNDITFTDADTGWLCGDVGLIFKTVDGGGTWNQNYTGITDELHGISFCNSSSGTAVGENGTILYTADGGTNWIPQYSGVFEKLNGVFSVSSDTIFTAGDNGTVLKISEGNWEEINYSGKENLNDILFINDKQGIVTGDSGRILTTSDGGTTWKAEILTDDVDFFTVASHGANLWMAGSFGSVYRMDSTSVIQSIDLAFNDTSVCSGDSLIISLDVITDLSGINVNNFQISVSWDTTLIHFNGISYENSLLNTVDYSSDISLYADRVSVSIGSSDNFPSKGRLFVLNFTVNESVFQTDTAFVHVYNLDFNVPGYVSRITSGGRIIVSQKMYTISGNVYYYSDSAAAVENVWIKGRSNKLDSVISGVGGDYSFSVSAYSGLKLWLSSAESIPESGVITPYDASLVLRECIQVDLLDSYQLLAGNTDGSVPGTYKLDPYDAALILKRSVGLINRFPAGNDWIFIPDNFQISRDNFYSYPDSVEWGIPTSDSVGYDFKAVVTGDVDGSWAELQELSKPGKIVTLTIGTAKKEGNETIVPVFLESEENLFACGFHINCKGIDRIIKGDEIESSGFMFETKIKNDGAVVGIAGKNPVSGNVHIFDMILKGDYIPKIQVKNGTVNGKLTTCVSKINNMPSEYRVNQNYPNPFNAETVIEYHIPESSYLTVKIYNVLGQEVKTLINGEVTPGKFRITWDGTTDSGEYVASGVYLLMFKSEGYMDIKKMVLTR